MSKKNEKIEKQNEIVNANVEIVATAHAETAGIETTETATNVNGETTETHEIFRVSAETTEKVRTLYNAGNGAKFAEIAKELNLTYYKAKEGKNTKGTPVVDVNGKMLDFHAFLRLVNVQVVTHERAKATAEPQTKSEKLTASYTTFVARVKELTTDQQLLKAIEDLNADFERVTTAMIDAETLNTTTKQTFAAAAGLLSFESQKALKGQSAEELAKDLAAFLAWKAETTTADK